MKQVCRKSLALTKNLTKDKQVKKQTKRTRARLELKVFSNFEENNFERCYNSKKDTLSQV